MSKFFKRRDESEEEPSESPHTDEQTHIPAENEENILDFDLETPPPGLTLTQIFNSSKLPFTDETRLMLFKLARVDGSYLQALLFSCDLSLASVLSQEGGLSVAMKTLLQHLQNSGLDNSIRRASNDNVAIRPSGVSGEFFGIAEQLRAQREEIQKATQADEKRRSESGKMLRQPPEDTKSMNEDPS